MNLTEIIAAVKQDVGSTTLFTDPEITRAVDRAVYDLSRYYPREQVKDFTINYTVDGEAFTSAVAHGTWVQLANEWLEPTRESVTNVAGNVTYTRGTDYYMDYASGKITTISGGAMSISTAYKISYKKHRAMLDLSTITGLWKVIKVEFPTGVFPQSYTNYEVIDGMLIMGSVGVGESQTYPTEKTKNAWVYYQTKHTAPTVSVAGSYPTDLDEVVIKGSIAFLYLMQAEKLATLGSTSLTSGTTSLSNCASLHDKINNAVTGYLKLLTDNITAGLAKLGGLTAVRASIATALGAATTALVAAGTSLTSMDALLTGVTNSSKAVLDGISYTEPDASLTAGAAQLTLAASALASIAALLTGLTNSSKATLDSIIYTGADADFTSGANQLNAAATALANIAALLTTASNTLAGMTYSEPDGDFLSQGTELGLANVAADQVPVTMLVADDLIVVMTSLVDSVSSVLAKITALNGVMDDLEGDLTAAMVTAWGATDISTRSANAVTLLETDADAYVNTVNLGEQVPEMYRRMAETEVAIMQSWMQKAKDYLTSGSIRAQLIQGLVADAQTYINTIGGEKVAFDSWMAIADRYTAESNERISAAKTYLEAAQIKLSKQSIKINQAAGSVSTASGFVEEASQRVAAGKVYTDIGNAKLSKIQLQNTQAEGYVNTARGFSEEASQRTAASISHIQAAGVYLSKVEHKVGQANGYIATARSFMEKSTVQVQSAEQYTRQTEAWIRDAETIIREAEVYNVVTQSYIGVIQRLIEEVAAYEYEADRHISISDKYEGLSKSQQEKGEYHMDLFRLSVRETATGRMDTQNTSKAQR